MKLGEKILILRKQHGMSQEQLAARILVSRQAISKWELSESLPDVDNIVQLSEVFNVTTDYLLKNGSTAYDANASTAVISDVGHIKSKEIIQPAAEETGVEISVANRVRMSPMAIGILGMVFVGLNILRRSHESALFPLAGVAVIVGMIVAFAPFVPRIQRPADTGLRLGRFMSDVGILAIIASGIFFSNSHARTILLYANIIAWLGLAIVMLSIIYYVVSKIKRPFTGAGSEYKRYRY